MIRYANKNDFESIQKLWYTCFNDSPKFSQWYFNNKYQDAYNIVYEKDNSIIAMAQCFKRKIKNFGKVSYLYGCCTNPLYRKQGIMSEVLNYIFDDDIKNNVKASILIPENEKLFDFYKKYGYDNITCINQNEINNCKSVLENYVIREIEFKDISEINTIYTDKLKNFYFVERSEEDWKEQIKLFNSVGGKCYCMEKNNKIISYAFLWIEDNLFIQECIGLDSKSEQQICSEIAEKYNIDRLIVNTVSCNMSKPLGCVKIYNNIITDKDFFINLMFN